MKWLIPILIYSPPFQKFVLLQSTGGGGAWASVPLSYTSGTGAARTCQGGGGGKKRGRVFPSHGKEIFFLCMKTAFSCTLNAIIGGVYVVTYTNSILSPFFKLLDDQQERGHGPLVPPPLFATPVYMLVFSLTTRICYSSAFTLVP